MEAIGRGIAKGKRGRRRWAFGVGLALLVGASMGMVAPLAAGPLEEYVQAADASFAWRVTERKVVEGLHVDTLALTSQTWRAGAWQHELFIARPATLRHPELAALLITSSANTQTLAAAKRLCDLSGGYTAVLTRVPNQPLFNGLKEDGIIAYTFDEYLKTGDATWPLLLPMTKSAVRALDAIQAWAQAEQAPPVRKFIVFGASKRGWTSWLTAAVDPRVIGVAPMVIDMLNMKAQTDWAAKVYGQQSEQIRDYTKRGLIEKMDLPPMVRLRELVDPYSYRARYTLPKLLLLGTNDRYWTVDSLRHYWAELPEPKLLYQAPNRGHEAGGTPEAQRTLAVFAQLLAEGKPLPRFTWTMSGADGATITATSDRPARQAVLWTTQSPTRDFRPARWSAQPLALDPARTRATGAVPKPTQGFAAAMLEFTFATEAGVEYRLSTQVQVTPDE